MEPFKIHILGCGSALPTLRHNPSAQVVELRGKQFMIDCGEGTQTQMRRSRIGFNKVVAIFIRTYWHALVFRIARTHYASCHIRTKGI